MNPKFNKPNLTANLSNPLSACWQTTKKCNYTCSHCIAAANPANLEELNTKNMKKIINKLSTAGIVRIDFTGGEPLLRKDMCKIIDYATKRGIYSILTSNGSVWSKKIENCLKRNMSLIQISIDGDEKTHEKLRISGSYAKALDTLRKFTSAGIKTRINFTVTKLNYRKIRFIYGLAKKNKISRLMYIMAAPQGRAANYENKFCLSEAQYKLAKKILSQSKKNRKVFSSLFTTTKSISNHAS